MRWIISRQNSYVYTFGFFLLFIYPTQQIAQTLTQSFTNVGKSQWTIPACVSVITMEVRGADGGNSDEAGGAGQRIIATFPVIPGEVLDIVVGEVGQGLIAQSAGGGGGSGVFNSTTNSLLVIAGGGGGGQGEGDGLGLGTGGNSVSTNFTASCSGFDTPTCGGSIFNPSGSGEGGGGGGGYLGMGQQVLASDGSGLSGFGGGAGFGVAGGVGAYTVSNLSGGYGAGGGGGASSLCAGGGGGGGYIGGIGGSRFPGPDGGGSGGSGFVNGVIFSEYAGATGGSVGQNGSVEFSYIINSTPTISASSTLTNNQISLTATFIASLTSTSAIAWQWTGPNGYTSISNTPPSFPTSTATQGIYTVQVIDNNNCLSTASTTVSLPNQFKEMQKIPTISEWGLIIYGLVILNFSLYFLLKIRKLQTYVGKSH